MTSILSPYLREQGLELPAVFNGKPELPPKPLAHGFAWDSVELFIRNRSPDHYAAPEHERLSRVYKLAREKKVSWHRRKQCYSGGVFQGLKVAFVSPSTEFFEGLHKLGLPVARSFVISRLDPRWDLTYDKDRAQRACAWLQYGMKQRYGRGLPWPFAFSHYSSSEHSSRNRDVYLKTQSVVRVEPRLQKPNAVARLKLDDPLVLARFTAEDFVRLFDQLLAWQPYTHHDLDRVAMLTQSPGSVKRALLFARHGWVHGRASMSISEVIAGWGIEAGTGVLV